MDADSQRFTDAGPFDGDYYFYVEFNALVAAIQGAGGPELLAILNQLESEYQEANRGR